MNLFRAYHFFLSVSCAVCVLIHPWWLQWKICVYRKQTNSRMQHTNKMGKKSLLFNDQAHFLMASISHKSFFGVTSHLHSCCIQSYFLCFAMFYLPLSICQSWNMSAQHRLQMSWQTIQRWFTKTDGATVRHIDFLFLFNYIRSLFIRLSFFGIILSVLREIKTCKSTWKFGKNQND